MPKRASQVSQKLIAKEAGVSQSTVSLVLAGREITSEVTRRKVLATAERLKYRPNLLVHGMQTGRSKMIGVMAPPFDSYWSEILYGIHDTLAAADHVPLTLWTAHQGPGPRGRAVPQGDELAQIHRLLDRRVDGVILWPPFASLFSRHVHEFVSRDLPVVTIDHRLPAEFGADYVGSDEAQGGRMVAAYLYSLGHRRLGHLAGPGVSTWAILRRRAFEESVCELDGASCVTFEAPSGDPSLGIETARALLAMPAGRRPTAVFAASDMYAKCVYKAATERGVRIPDDLSVVGYSDDDFTAEMSPPLTTVHQPAYEIGSRAAEVILRRSSGEIRERRAVVDELPVRLVVRGSCRVEGTGGHEAIG